MFFVFLAGKVKPTCISVVLSPDLITQTSVLGLSVPFSWEHLVSACRVVAEDS
jgi:hypothetical protein